MVEPITNNKDTSTDMLDLACDLIRLEIYLLFKAIYRNFYISYIRDSGLDASNCQNSC